MIFLQDKPLISYLISCEVRYIRVITKLPNSEQSYKGKVKTHKYINRQNQSTRNTSIFLQLDLTCCLGEL